MIRRWNVAIALVIASAPVAASAAPSSPLGRDARCRSGYAKRTLTHKVNGRPVAYVACVPLPTTTTRPVKPADLVAKPTATRLTVSQVNLVPPKGPSSIVQEWKARVSGVGGNPAPVVAPGELTFVLADESRVLAIFTTTAATSCTATLTEGPVFGTILQVAPPCTGGVGGYATITFEQGQSHKVSLRAVYAGSPGWSPSSSGTLLPLDVSPGSPWSV